MIGKNQPEWTSNDKPVYAFTFLSWFFMPFNLFTQNKQSCCEVYYTSMVSWLKSITGGANGGTANSWNSATSTSKVFLAVALFSLFLPIVLDGWDTEAVALEELLLSIVAKNFSFESVVGADAITELKTPDSLSPWIMAWDEQKI